MPVEVPTFSDLDAADILEQAELIAAMIGGALPSLNVNRGSMIWETVIYLAAVGNVYSGTPINTLNDFWNLAAVVADPDNADESLTDLLLSNFNAARSGGTKATGQVEIVITEAHAMTISAGTIFTAGTLEFTNLTNQVVVVDSDDTTADTDRVLVERTDGTYSFKVDVQALVAGDAGNVTDGTTFTVSPRPTYFSTATAAADLSGGADPDSNTTMILTLRMGSLPRFYPARLAPRPSLCRSCPVPRLLP